jgi:hypothetical protein
MRREYYSNYYERLFIFDKDDLDYIVTTYLKYCKENKLQPEITNDDYISFGFDGLEPMMDHLLYHVEIEDPDFL